MIEIAHELRLADGDIVSIIGCGGKTTLMWSLARHFKNRRVLVSTTTKIGRPRPDLYDSITDATELERLWPPAQVAPGVHLAATLHDKADKLHIKSLPLSDLQAISPGFDLCLLEADGSRNLPLKGWAAHEPVIPSFSSVTIGLATVSCLGRALNEDCVHRPQIFARLAGAKPGEAISLAHMAAATAHPEGLMARAVGRKIIIINQLDDEAALKRAHEFVSLLPPVFLDEIELVLGASLALRKAVPLWRK